MKKIIAVIGDGMIEKGGDKYRLAFALGRALVDNGYRLQTGGMNGVMAAACEGARVSEKYTGNEIIAVAPGFDPGYGNGFADITIPTGLDFYRNIIVANASAVVAIGGGAGTLSEMAAAWTLKRLLIAYTGVDGWSAKLAGQKVDNKTRYENIPEDVVYAAESADDVIKLLGKYLESYTKYHSGIKL